MAPFIRKGLLVTVAVVGMMAGTMGPATANAPGAGTFVGHEHVAQEPVLNPATMCAEYAAGTEHHLVMTGTFHGTPGVGTATYTATENYAANPEGTYEAGGCPTSPAAVDGSMVIQFGPWTCSDTSATFERRLTSVYTLQFSGTCTNSATGQSYATQVTYTGVMTPCDPIVGCPVVHPNGSTEFAQALMEGAYQQSG